ncbi:MAG: glutamate synthase large subunit, partial [Candidatus Puniceispirillaceae bacterium]
PSASYIAEQNTIIGNTVLYGATSGLLLANGQAGERFAVRNSGASSIIEGCGSNGCEYMTGGEVVILGRTGSNFGAGMTGGMAFIYDKDGEFLSQVNPETLHISKLSTGYWKEYLEGRVALHASETDSALAKRLLNNWEVESSNFWHVVPTEVLGLLPQPVADNEIPVRSA